MSGGPLLLVVCKALGGLPGTIARRGAFKGLQAVIGPLLVMFRERTSLASSDCSLAQSWSHGQVKQRVDGGLRGMEERL